ncbi:MAG: HlyD family efflux transporter periplasmic adaptor subunit [Candidatus Binatia bacterium]
MILELADPQLQQQKLEAETQLRAAEADLASLKARLDTERLNQKSAAATVESDYEQARLEREVNEDLAKDGLVSSLVLKQSTVRADSLRTRAQLEKERVAVTEESVRAQLLGQQARVDQLRTLFALRAQQVDQLRVKAGMTGVLEQVPVEVGQQVAPGTNVARVADPNRLKAELRIAETQARDLSIGQVAQVDTRNGIIPGKVVRIDPAAQNGTVTVDVELTGALPRGARPDLSVDGTVELERLDNVLYVGRPAFGQENSAVGLFRLDGATGDAVRTQVQLGRSSVNTIEIKGGAKEGDELVLSDMSAWDAFDRVRLR